MGGKSKKSSGGSSVPKATESSTVGMYNNLLGGQLGTIGDTLGGLIEHGQKFMESNPAAANFIRVAGGQPMQFEAPGFIKDMRDRAAALSPAEAARQNPQPTPENPSWMQFVSPEQRARYDQYTGVTQPSQFNINDFMRNQKLGGQGGR